MGDQPGFGVENPLMLALIVLGRIVADREELVQRQQRFIGQQAQVARNWFADASALAAGQDFKRGVDFGHTLLEPKRPNPVIPAQ